MNFLSLKLKPYIQPFERKLALLELEALAKESPEPVDGRVIETATLYKVSTSACPKTLADRLVYWEAVAMDNESFTTLQVKREATVSIARNGKSLEEIVAPVPAGLGPPEAPNRRCLRYGSHGLHEYRGKFFPQLVRSLINTASLPLHGLVGDPMCGSGTTAVEVVLAGHTAQVMDMNPLSVFMTRTKCDILRVRPKTLQTTFATLFRSLNKQRPRKEARYIETLSHADQEYLHRWLSEEVLAALDTISLAISDVQPKELRNFFRLSLSNILRRVSWQRDADLRVRKDSSKTTSFRQTIDLFLSETESSARYTAAFLTVEHPNVGACVSCEGDAKYAASTWPEKCDAIITSPPYATALPYLDTDRLSLIYLNLLSRKNHRSRDQTMIGNREITEKHRSNLWESFQRGDTLLPDEAIRLIKEVHTRNAKDPEAGFRRRNLPSLLYAYFRDMRATIASMRDCTKLDGNCYIVVGDNQTTAGGKKIRIPTIRLLQDIAISEGFTLIDVIPMEMLTNREIHRKNATPSESIIWVRNGGSQ